MQQLVWLVKSYAENTGLRICHTAWFPFNALHHWLQSKYTLGFLRWMCTMSSNEIMAQFEGDILMLLPETAAGFQATIGPLIRVRLSVSLVCSPLVFDAELSSYMTTQLPYVTRAYMLYRHRQETISSVCGCMSLQKLSI